VLAIAFQRTGGPEVLEVVEKPVPTPGPGQILVRHAAVGLNFIDTYQRSGLYKIPLPSGLGSEAAGTVEAVGEGVARFKPGDPVAYASGPLGAYAEFHVTRADKAVHVPEGVSLETAAACLLKGMTAEYLLRRTHRVEAGETILVHAAAGGVGQILVQWGKALGATVIATAGGPAKTALAASLGADHVIDYDREDVAARVREITGGAGVPVAYDSVGAATFEATLASIARRGLFASFGNASGPPPPVPPGRLNDAGSIYLTRPKLGDYIVTVDELDGCAGALFEVIRSGAVKIDIGQRFPLKEARAAHEALEGRRTVGASVLIP
jgi:NADPH2:quinone reductase